MDVALVLVTWIVCICFFVILVYWIVTSAVESSKLANEVNELKQLVQQLVNDQKISAYEEIASSLAIESDNVKCTACGSEYMCSECDLSNGESKKY